MILFELNQPNRMNKQNLIKNISLLNRKKSPTPNKPSVASFKNIHHKSFLRQPQDSSLSPLHSKRPKTNTFRDSSVIHTEMSESAISVHNNNLSEAFRLERQSLLNSVTMYKEQVEVLTIQTNKWKKESKSYKSHLKQKEQHMMEHIKKNAELTHKVHQYQNMLPKLIELQNLQERIIGENNGLKNKLKMQEALLNNVANISKYQQPKTPAIEKIYALTQIYHTGVSTTKKNK